MSNIIDEETLLHEFSMVDPEQQTTTIFDYEVINDEDKELWLFREPDKVPETSIACMKLKFTSTRGKCLSKLHIGDDMLNLYRVPHSKDLDADVGVGGHEMLGFSCLVPCRNAKGKMMLAPKKISQCFTLKDDGVTDIYPSNTSTSSQVVNLIHDSRLMLLKHPYIDSSIGSVATPTKKIKNDDNACITKKWKLAKDSDDDETIY